ncbi:MAG: hypothetical protein JW791_01490 [Nanoarchaeota archaeon]|nr:hypothetical protein [Nanoarchaeota archaeon]
MESNVEIPTLEEIIEQVVQASLRINVSPESKNFESYVDLNGYYSFCKKKIRAFAENVSNILDKGVNNVIKYLDLTKYFLSYFNDKEGIRLVNKYSRLLYDLTKNESQINELNVLAVSATAGFFEFLSDLAVVNITGLKSLKRSSEVDMVNHYIVLDNFMHLNIKGFNEQVPKDFEEFIHEKIAYFVVKAYTSLK